MNNEIKQLKKQVAIFLLNLYHDTMNSIEIDYELVDSFYTYLGYELEVDELLFALGINGTSDLQELLMNAQ